MLRTGALTAGDVRLIDTFNRIPLACCQVDWHLDEGWLQKMKVSQQYAFGNFDERASAVDGGELVEIHRADKPALHLVRSTSGILPVPARQRRLHDRKALLRVPTESERAEMDHESQIDLNSSVFPQQLNAAKRA